MSKARQIDDLILDEMWCVDILCANDDGKDLAHGPFRATTSQTTFHILATDPDGEHIMIKAVSNLPVSITYCQNVTAAVIVDASDTLGCHVCILDSRSDGTNFDRKPCPLAVVQ